MKANYIISYESEKVKINSTISFIPEIKDIVRIKGFVLQTEYKDYQYFIVTGIKIKKDKIKIKVDVVDVQ